jgi:hypothetical protein
MAAAATAACRQRQRTSTDIHHNSATSTVTVLVACTRLVAAAHQASEQPVAVAIDTIAASEAATELLCGVSCLHKARLQAESKHTCKKK